MDVAAASISSSAQAMSPPYRMTPGAEWAAAQALGGSRLSTRGKTLAEEGFIHCSHAHQVVRVADAIYAGARGLVLLVIDPAAVRGGDAGGGPRPGGAGVRGESTAGWPAREDRFPPHLRTPQRGRRGGRASPSSPAADGSFELPPSLRSQA